MNSNRNFLPSFEGGLYLHIPFCKQACNYCNFHFSTSLAHKDRFIDALILEIKTSASLFLHPKLRTIYFGGGTPSLLSITDLHKIFDAIYAHFDCSDVNEITIEANPDDITVAYCSDLKKTPINRFSIGIQSFFDDDLLWMRRAHNAQEALQCIYNAQDAGITNISADLIFGYPLLNEMKLRSNVQQLIDANIPHISAYSLTIEPGTPLSKKINLGKDIVPNQGEAAQQFVMLDEILTQAGFHHYEVSNYALPGQYAQHNSAYWMGYPYIGVGPSAHSFYNGHRYWNIANNSQYIKALFAGRMHEESEFIDHRTAYNEYIMTRLRTIWGVTLKDLEEKHPAYKDYFLSEVRQFLEAGTVIHNDGIYTLNIEGMLVADHIASNLFWVAD